MSEEPVSKQPVSKQLVSKQLVSEEHADGGQRRAVRASGGIVVRSVDGRREVALVHRPRYMDWSLPKGKPLSGETDEACALREVEEEIGARCEIGHEIQGTFYSDQKGRRKLVRYWEMTPVYVAPRDPDDEIDAVEWMTLAAARERLTHERDREILDAFLLQVERHRA